MNGGVMSQRLFSVPKVGLFLDSYAPSIEKRRGEEVKVLTLTLRLQPLDAKIATAIDDGLGDDSGVKAGLFKLSNGEPKPHIKRLDFRLDCPRQNLIVYSTPDTARARMALTQAKITGTYARTQKDLNGYAFVFKASLGPVGRDEQEFIHEWLLTQRFVTFETSEPSMQFDDDGADDDVADDADETPSNRRPPPMWDSDDANSAPPQGVAADRPEKARRLPRRHATKAHTQPRKRR
jgi:hypothetical protein